MIQWRLHSANKLHFERQRNMRHVNAYFRDIFWHVQESVGWWRCPYVRWWMEQEMGCLRNVDAAQDVWESLWKLYLSALSITTISIFRLTLSVLRTPILYLNTLHFLASNDPLLSCSVLTFLSFNFPFFYKCHSSSLQFPLLYCIF